MSEKKYKTPKEIQKEKEVEEMLENWDKVTCCTCGKIISMLEAHTVTVNGYETFECERCYNGW